jgi:diguanylate cyclase (GGDEF)-like protein
LLDDVDSSATATDMAKKMIESIEAIQEVSAGRVDVSASIGVAMFPEHGLTEEDVRSAADAAMYSAKRAGKRCVHLFEHGKTK